MWLSYLAIIEDSSSCFVPYRYFMTLITLCLQEQLEQTTMSAYVYVGHMSVQSTGACHLVYLKKQIYTDDSFLSEKGKAGTGGTVRDNTGELIMAFSATTQCFSNNQAKAFAALYGVRWCNQNGYTSYDLEMGSLVIANMIRSGDTNNLKLRKIIREVVQMTEIAFALLQGSQSSDRLLG